VNNLKAWDSCNVKLTREQIQSKKDAAVRFLDNVKHDPDRAAEVEDESLEDYAARRDFEIIENPRRLNSCMANGQSKEDLQNEIQDLQGENDYLQSQLDAISDVLAGPDDDGSDDDGDDQGD